MAGVVRTLPKPVLLEDVKETAVYRYQEEALFDLVKEEIYHVTGKWIENLVDSTNFENNESLQYFQRLIRRKGVIDALEKAGVQEGDLVALHDLTFEYIRVR